MATMRRSQSWTSPSHTPVSTNKLRRSSQSLPAVLPRRSIISLSTDTVNVDPDAPILQRVVPKIRLELTRRVDPSDRRGVALVVERPNRRRARVVTHTLTVDAWLLTILLMFTLIGSSGGFVLPAIPVGAQRFSPADVAPYVAGDPGFSGSAQFPHASQPSQAECSGGQATDEQKKARAVDQVFRVQRRNPHV